MRTKNMVVTLMATALLASFAGSSAAQESGQTQQIVGKQAPALKVSAWRNTNGKTLSLKSLRGKVVVLDFWAYW